MSNYRRTQIGNVLTLLIPKRLLRFVTDNRICAETIFILKLKNSQLSHRSKDTVDIFIVIIFAPFEMVSMHERILKISNGLPPATVSEDLSCRAIHFVHILRGTSYTTIAATRIPISWRQEITAHPLVGAEAIPNICSIIGIVSNSNRIALVQRSIVGFADSIAPLADEEFRSAYISFYSDGEADFRCATYLTKGTLYVKNCQLQKKKASGGWLNVGSAITPDYKASNATSYLATIDFSDSIGTGTYRITCTFVADDYTLPKASAERTFN